MASKLTKVIANFETTLATKLASGAVTGSLSNVTDKNGVALPNGAYCMIVDRGTGDEEHLLFDLVGNAMSGIQSIGRQGLRTVGVQNANGHRVGAKCALTDFVNLKMIVDILNGIETLDASSPLLYDADPTFSNTKQLVSKGYADAQDAQMKSDILTGNKNYSGANTFSKPPSVPTPLSANDAVNLAYVLSLAFGGVLAVGFNKMTVNHDAQGRVKNVRDNELGKSYLVTYDTQDEPIKIFDGVHTWRFVYTGDKLSAITKI